MTPEQHNAIISALDRAKNQGKQLPTHSGPSNPIEALAMLGIKGHVAPLDTADTKFPWEGRGKTKPWHRSITVAIPHLNTPEILETCIRLYQLQTVTPYILVIDTGSNDLVRSQLEQLRSESVEVHYVRSHGYMHSSEPVTLAMDFAFSRCQTDLMVSSHADVFLRRRDSLEWLAKQCNAGSPVVGWQQSSRHAGDCAPECKCAEQGRNWMDCVSHTFTAWHMPTMRRIGATWNFKRYYEAEGIPSHRTYGYPDTEQPINRCLKQAGIAPVILGPEPNFERHVTDWYDHARTITSLRIYNRGGDKLAKAEGYTASALADARQRIAEWSGGPTLLQLAANFGTAVAGHVANGMKPAEPAEKERRLAICRSNKCELYDPNGTCKHPKCGCNLEKKAGWDSESCPAGHW